MSSIAPRRLLTPLLAATACCLFLSGCATNPVTGKKEFNLLSEGQEVELGRDSDAQIVAQYGLVDDPELAAYIETVGQRMVPVSHRPDLPFTFRLLDDPVVNAFALPGGYVYITRGILAYLETEAALAGVTGHEIGHVTARHGAQRYTEQMLFGAGAAIGASLMKDVPGAGQALGAATSLLLLKYGRDDERQSDQLGVEYATKVGYDTVTMAEFFQILDTLSGDRGGLPGWASTHPDPGERYATVLSLTQEWQLQAGKAEYVERRNEFLRRLDGLVYGPNPRAGFVHQGSFVHPDMAFRFPVPLNWQLNNLAAQVQMAPEDGSAVMLFLIDDEYTSAVRAADRMAATEGITVISRRNTEIGGYPAVILESSSGAGTPDELSIQSAYIHKDGRVYIFHGLSRPTDAGRWKATFTTTARGFRALTDPQLLNIQPVEIHVVSAPAKATFGRMLSQYPIPDGANIDAAGLALMNGMSPDQSLPEGTLVKVLVRRGAPQ